MPTEKPYRFTDRRRWAPGAAQVVESARPHPQRKFHAGFDRDASRIIQGTDRRALMSIGRWLYWNDPIVRGCINDIANISSGSLSVQFNGVNQAWGETAEDWLGDHDRMCCIRGYPYTMQVLSRLAVIHRLIDGDCFFLLTEGESGWPLLQFIPAHRVRGDFAKANVTNVNGEIQDSPWADYPVRDGVIMDDYGRPLAYRVWDDMTFDFRDVDAANMVHVYDAEAGDQIRGISCLAASIGDFSDLGETRRFELIAQKLGASIALTETNETGTPPDDASQIIGADSSMTTDDKPPVYGTEMHGGEVRYFRAGSGSKLEALNYDRPSNNQREFAREIARNALHGLGWSIDYSLDPTRIGGAPARIVVEKINRTLSNIREHTLFPFRRRVDGWRIAKAEKAGFLPPSTGNDWRAWSYKGASDLTADAMYSAQVTELELSKGLTSLRVECAKRGHDWQQVVRDKVQEAVFIRDECAKAGIDPLEIRVIATQSTQTLNDPNADDANTAPANTKGSDNAD